MTGHMMHHFRHRDLRYLTVLFLLAFLGKALMPAGFMPDTDADGKVRIVICTPSGPSTALVDLSATPFPDHGEDGDKHTNTHSPCPYAPVVAQDLPFAVPALPGLFTQPVILSFVLHSSVYSISPKPWQAQGPPFLS